MAELRMDWTPPAKTGFEALRQRAVAKGVYEIFMQAHNEIVVTLRDPQQAAEKGELLYKTRKPGGEVRHWIHRFISVHYAIFPQEQVGWIFAYKPIPQSWPERKA